MAKIRAGSTRSRNFHGNVFVEIDDDGRFFAKCQPMFERELRRVVREIADRARDIIRTEHERTPSHPRARKPTGNLRRSVRPYKGRGATIRKVGVDEIAAEISAGSRIAYYAPYVHEGTRMHKIRAKPGGALSFVGAGRYGRKTFTRRRLRELNDDEWLSLGHAADLDQVGYVREEYNAAARRYNRRLADRAAGRRSWLRHRDADVIIQETQHSYAERKVVIPYPQHVNHPGYRGSKFLTRAAREVVAKRYGGDFFPSRGRSFRQIT